MECNRTLSIFYANDQYIILFLSLSLSVSVRFPVILEFVLLLDCCLIVVTSFYLFYSFRISSEFGHHLKLSAMQHFG
jgi:hypothetical protein